MPAPHEDSCAVEEHELPCVEAQLACTLALMTGYSQALLAELHPRQRVAIGEKVGEHLALLVRYPMLSIGFRQVLLGLQTRWDAMRACSHGADHACAADAATRPAHTRCPAPKRLQ